MAGDLDLNARQKPARSWSINADAKRWRMPLMMMKVGWDGGSDVDAVVDDDDREVNTETNSDTKIKSNYYQNNAARTCSSGYGDF